MNIRNFISKFKLKHAIWRLGRMIIKLTKFRKEYEHYYETVDKHDTTQQILIYNFLNTQLTNYRKQGLYIRILTKQRRKLRRDLKALENNAT